MVGNPVDISYPWRLPVCNPRWQSEQIPINKSRIFQWNISYTLEMKGENSKAAVWMNGRLVGSDDEWLQRGRWGKAVLDLWSPYTSVDRIIITLELIKESEGRIVLVLEDVSDATRRVQFLDYLRIVITTERQVLEKIDAGIRYL